MRYKRLILLVIIIAVVAIGLMFALHNRAPEQYSVALDAKSVALYTGDDEPIRVMALEGRGPHKSGDKSDLISTENRIHVWIE